MKNIIITVVCVTCFLSASSGQNYTSYFTGDTIDFVTTPSGGVCLMGGSTEDDNAMRWFLQQANGGDILVLRASGSDGYNDYLYSELGVQVNSVETILCHNALASSDPYLHQKIQQAEAIWFAGGNQWNYVSFWRNTAVDSLINDAIINRDIVIGGTSAGMAIQGGFYFSTENGTVTSATALSNPFDSHVTVDSSPFIVNDFLADVITDTHYDNPDRKGRHLVFLSRILIDHGIAAKGIACDEYTAVCIDTDGIARVFGDHPTYDDNAYFIQTNCELDSILPENCSSDNPLHWELGGQAIKVFAVKGTSSGENTFDLNDWKSATGGVWENWYVNNGDLMENPGTPPECQTLSIADFKDSNAFEVYPNPSNDFVTISFAKAESKPELISITNVQGKEIKRIVTANEDELSFSTSDMTSGLYFIKSEFNGQQGLVKKLIIK